jgi:hypothetical protein
MLEGHVRAVDLFAPAERVTSSGREPRVCEWRNEQERMDFTNDAPGYSIPIRESS